MIRRKDSFAVRSRIWVMDVRPQSVVAGGFRFATNVSIASASGWEMKVRDSKPALPRKPYAVYPLPPAPCVLAVKNRGPLGWTGGSAKKLYRENNPTKLLKTLVSVRKRDKTIPILGLKDCGIGRLKDFESAIKESFFWRAFAPWRLCVTLCIFL